MTTSITPLPAAPSRATGADTFSAAADAFTAALVVMAVQMNALGGDVTALAAMAAASAASAVNAPGTSATSTTSLTITTGSVISIGIQTGKAFAVGQVVSIAYTASAGNRMVGLITGTDPTAGTLSVFVQAASGGGTYAAWTVALSSPIDLLAATISQLLSGTSTTTFVTPAALIGAMAWQTLTDAATVAWDLRSGINAIVTLGGNRTIAMPSYLVPGLDIILVLINDGTGSRVPSWATGWDFGDAGLPSMPTAGGAEMWIYGKVRTNGTIAAARIR